MEFRAFSDAQVIEASLTEPRFFETIFDRHFGAVHRFAVGRVGAQDAPDVVAETFARAFDRRHRFALDKPSALPWLFGIAVNVCRERGRRASRGVRANTRMAVRAEMITEPFENALAERIDAERLLPELIGALRALSDDEYALLMLATESDLTYEEMAETLGIPVGTVRSRLARARRRVRAELRSTSSTTRAEIHGSRD
ncbi:MAG: sigma-70 family RNA polymerase sigma factor [Acidimicrobiia bacterium]